jgi:thiosulfate reductase cytochrome b subunit
MFGGRQSARTIHFMTASCLVLFFIVHIVAVVAAGPLVELRSMVTGWFVINTEKGRS